MGIKKYIKKKIMKKLLIVLLLSIGVKTNALTVEQVWSEIQCNDL